MPAGSANIFSGASVASSAKWVNSRHESVGINSSPFCFTVSAFYAEHYNKKITFTAHVWTKSKFLGLSIGVHNIGEGVVTLVDRSEEYIVTFPNGYGRYVIINNIINNNNQMLALSRSILTVPWIELGGSVEIKCPQTGYYANVEFLTKPFYGGKRNKVSAEVR